MLCMKPIKHEQYRGGPGSGSSGGEGRGARCGGGGATNTESICTKKALMTAHNVVHNVAHNVVHNVAHNVVFI